MRCPLPVVLHDGLLWGCTCRLEGANRFSTSCALAKTFLPSWLLPLSRVSVPSVRPVCPSMQLAGALTG